MRDSGLTEGGGDPTATPSTPSASTGTTAWLRASARALGRAVRWLLDRIGFLTG